MRKFVLTSNIELSPYSLLSLVLLIYLSLPVTRASEIKIATIDWCPYVCDLNSDAPGILVEYVQLAFRNTGINTSFSIYPWSRAIKEVESGKETALLAPARNETPQLIFPKHPIGQQQFCFFTRKSDTWQYHKPQDLFGRVSLYPTNALPDELLVLADHSDILTSRSYTDSFSENTTKLLLNGFLDAVINTDFSMMYYLSQSGLQDAVNNAGCLEATDLYLAFTPEVTQQESIKVFVHLIDRALEDPQIRNKMTKLAAKYGIE